MNSDRLLARAAGEAPPVAPGGRTGAHGLTPVASRARHSTPGQRVLLRLVTPLTKLVTGKQAVAVTSEVIEGFGGAGYVEDTGLPQLLRDAQVLPIWEGTTNVLSLEVLLRSDLHAGLAALMGRVSACVRSLSDLRLAAAGRPAMGAVERSALWLQSGHDRDVLQASARRLALTLGRALQRVPWDSRWRRASAGQAFLTEHDGFDGPVCFRADVV